MDHQIEQGKRLKELRKFLGLNQQQLAQTLEVTQPFLSSIENGKSSLSRNLLTHISNSYPHINTNWLLTGAGEMVFRTLEKQLPISEAKEQQVAYAQPKTEINQLQRRMRYLEQFIAKKFPDFSPDETP